jgi:thioredoxin 1
VRRAGVISVITGLRAECHNGELRSHISLAVDVVGADAPAERYVMATLPLTEESFEQTVTQDGIVLVDFWASWCGPCRMFAPVYEKASETHGDITFASIDTEAEQMLAGGLQITSIPTLMAFRDGILVFRQAGALPAPALEELITAVRGLDMDDVRRQVAEQEAKQA